MVRCRPGTSHTPAAHLFCPDLPCLFSPASLCPEIPQGQKKAPKAEPTPAERDFRRKSAAWLIGAGLVSVSYILFSGQYIEVSPAVQGLVAHGWASLMVKAWAPMHCHLLAHDTWQIDKLPAALDLDAEGGEDEEEEEHHDGGEHDG